MDVENESRKERVANCTSIGILSVSVRGTSPFPVLFQE
jgi:hypothetical protein